MGADRRLAGNERHHQIAERRSKESQNGIGSEVNVRRMFIVGGSRYIIAGKMGRTFLRYDEIH